MIVKIHFNHLDPTEAIKQKIQEKSEKLGKFFDGNFEVDWTCSVDKSGHHSHVILSGDRMTFNADSIKDQLYKTFDDIVEKLQRQLEKKKSMSRNHIHRRGNGAAMDQDIEEESGLEEEL